MAKADQLVIEVHYVPLSADEMVERRARLYSLLLRGAMRFLQQLSKKPEPVDVFGD
jgi:hypothetical protein